jgi:proteasome activator subunit 4
LALVYAPERQQDRYGVAGACSWRGDKSRLRLTASVQVLAVAAAVLSAPTEVPAWMPDAVCSLCVLQDEEAIIRSSVLSTIGDFRKSHQDSWEEIRMTWGEDQLRLLSENSGTQSYFS